VKIPRYIILLSLILLAACGGQATPTLYIPVTEAPAPQTLPQISPALDSHEAAATSPPLSTSSPECTSGLIFLDDISIPDGTFVSPGQILDKRWSVENNGSCNWNQEFSLQLIAGPELGVSTEQALHPARSGSQAQIQILFTAPQEPGTHRSAWQARDPGGKLFGDPIFIEVTVVSP
jgi:hypothetical protein